MINPFCDWHRLGHFILCICCGEFLPRIDPAVVDGNGHVVMMPRRQCMRPRAAREMGE